MLRDMPRRLALGLAVSLAACPATPADRNASLTPVAPSEASVAVPVGPDPGCRKNTEDHPNREVESREMVLPLSLAKFGSTPTEAQGLATWAMSPTPVTSTCRTVGTSEPHTGFYRGGGFIQSYCSYTLGGRQIASETELAAALVPIDSPREALAMIGLARVIAFDSELSSPRPEKKVRMPLAIAARTPAVDAFDVARFEGGFIVRVPEESSCPHSVVRRAYRVTTEGSLCEANEPSILLDVGDGICVD